MRRRRAVEPEALLREGPAPSRVPALLVVRMWGSLCPVREARDPAQAGFPTCVTPVPVDAVDGWAAAGRRSQMRWRGSPATMAAAVAPRIGPKASEMPAKWATIAPAYHAA